MSDRFEQKLDRCLELLSEMKVDVAKNTTILDRNTIDIQYHIKRTDKIEKDMQKMVVLLAVGAGIGLSLFGPKALSLLGIVL